MPFCKSFHHCKRASSTLNLIVVLSLLHGTHCDPLFYYNRVSSYDVFPTLDILVCPTSVLCGPLFFSIGCPEMMVSVQRACSDVTSHLTNQSSQQSAYYIGHRNPAYETAGMTLNLCQLIIKQQQVVEAL